MLKVILYRDNTCARTKKSMAQSIVKVVGIEVSSKLVSKLSFFLSRAVRFHVPTISDSLAFETVSSSLEQDKNTEIKAIKRVEKNSFFKVGF